MKLSRQAKAIISDIKIQESTVKNTKRGSIDPQINSNLKDLESLDFLGNNYEARNKRVSEIFNAWFLIKQNRDDWNFKVQLCESTAKYLNDYFLSEYETDVSLDILVLRAVDFYKHKQFAYKGYKNNLLKLAKNAWTFYHINDIVKEVGKEKIEKALELFNYNPMDCCSYPILALYNNIPLKSLSLLIAIENCNIRSKKPKVFLSRDQIRKILILQGAFSSRSYNKYLQADLGKYLAGTNYCKGLSITEFKHMIEGIKFWTNAHIALPIKVVAPSFFTILGKLNSNELRYAAIHEMSAGIEEVSISGGRFKYAITKKLINWQCIKEVQDLMLAGKNRLVLNHESQPKARKFFKEHGIYIKSKSIPNQINTKALNALKKAGHLDKKQGLAASVLLLDAIKISNIFGMAALNVLENSLVLDWPVDNIHDFVNEHNIKEGSKPLSQQWNQFFANNIDLATYAEYVKEDMPVFKSREQFIHFVRTQKYTNVPEGFEHLVDLCVRHEFSQSEFQRFVEAVKQLNNKTSEMLPFIRIDGSNVEGAGHLYTLEKLDANDPAVLLVGLDTSCCQHITGAGRSCAIHSYEQADSAVYVVRKNGKIVAQSWVWHNTGDGVVFDSIEVNVSERNNYAPIACMFKELANQLVGKLMIDSVYVGKTSYGMTQFLLSYMGKLNDSIYSTKMITSCYYMDGRDHYLVAASESYVKKHLSFDSDILTVCA